MIFFPKSLAPSCCVYFYSMVFNILDICCQNRSIFMSWARYIKFATNFVFFFFFFSTKTVGRCGTRTQSQMRKGCYAIGPSIKCMGALASVVRSCISILRSFLLKRHLPCEQHDNAFVRFLCPSLYPFCRRAHTIRGFFFFDIHRSSERFQKHCAEQFSRTLLKVSHLDSQNLCWLRDTQSP